MHHKIIHELFGWYCMIAIIGAYFLVTFNFVGTDSLTYNVLNLTGALGIAFVSFQKRAYPPGVLNVIWALIAIIALFRLFA